MQTRRLVVLAAVLAAGGCRSVFGIGVSADPTAGSCPQQATAATPAAVVAAPAATLPTPVVSQPVAVAAPAPAASATAPVAAQTAVPASSAGFNPKDWASSTVVGAIADEVVDLGARVDVLEKKSAPAAGPVADKLLAEAAALIDDGRSAEAVFLVRKFRRVGNGGKPFPDNATCLAAVVATKHSGLIGLATAQLP